jgi:hypothetical protein
VNQVLERLRRYKLFINLKKCAFNTNTIEFLGFVISPISIIIKESRVITIKE